MACPSLRMDALRILLEIKILFSTHSYMLWFREEICFCICHLSYTVFSYNITGVVLWSVGLTNVLKLWIVASNSKDTFLCVVANSINIRSTLNLFPCTSQLSTLIPHNSHDMKPTLYSTTLTCLCRSKTLQEDNNSYRRKYLRLVVAVLIPLSKLPKLNSITVIGYLQRSRLMLQAGGLFTESEFS